MVHVHAIQHGDYVKQAVLQDFWGGRIVDIRRGDPAHAAYMSKAAGAVAQYQIKGARDLDNALSLNGGRLHHWSRGFFGQPIREALREMRGAAGADLTIVRDTRGAYRSGSWCPPGVAPARQADH
jgi:hypothetical protein